MNETMSDLKYVGKWAVYNGVHRANKFGNAAYEVVQETDDHRSVAFELDGKLEWVNVNSVQFVGDVLSNSIDEIFTHAAGGHLEMAKNEVIRLEARIAELKQAIKVMETL